MNPPALTPHLPLAVSGFEIVLVLLFVVGGLIKSFFDKAVGSGGKSPTMTTPPLVPPRPSVSSEEERARRLMEALGLPAATPPPAPLPPVAVPRPVPPPLPPNLVVTRRAVPPPLPLALPLDPPRTMPRPVAKRRRPDPDPILRRGPAGAGSTGQDARPPASTTTLRGLLRVSSRAELRRAILLREVLGPPRALAELGEAN